MSIMENFKQCSEDCDEWILNEKEACVWCLRSKRIDTLESELTRYREAVNIQKKALLCVKDHDYGKADLFETMKNTVLESLWTVDALLEVDRILKGDAK